MNKTTENRLGGELRSQQAARRLLEELRRGRYADAAQLPSELELADVLGVSRTVVRDALSDLERDGYVERVRGIGTLVNRDVVRVENRMDQKLEFNRMIRSIGRVPHSDNLMVTRETATPELAHEIGLALAKKLWGEKYQVLVATHLDRENHLHNHFVVNTVSFVDGIKYHRTEQDYFDMQRESDRLCREYGLSVIENPQRGKSKHYGEWRAEQEGRPTYLSLIKADVDTAIRQSMTERQFFYHLRQMGYDIKVGKDITVRPLNYPRGRKLMRNFGEDYSMENIRRRILAQRRPQREHRPEPFRCRLHGDLKQAKKVTGFRALYFHYCYLLGVFPQKQNRPPRRVPHALREDLIRAQELTDEACLLSRHRIDTLEQLNAYRSDVKSQFAGLTEQRKSLYRKLRTKAVLADPARQEYIRAEISKLSAQIKELRREVKLCGDIALRSTSIKDKIQAAREEVSGRDEKARQEPEQGRAAPPGRR